MKSNLIEKNSKDIEIIIKYRKNDEFEIQIFGQNFVNNNKDKCKIIYEGKEYDLKQNLNVQMIKMKQKLKIIKIITNLADMFSGML